MSVFVILFLSLFAAKAQASALPNLRTEVRWCAEIFEKAHRLSVKLVAVEDDLIVAASKTAQERHSGLLATQPSRPVQDQWIRYDYLTRYLNHETVEPADPDSSFLVRGLVQQGLSVSDALDALEVNDGFRSFYDSDGNFVYRATHGKTLAVENGRARLDAIHIGFTEEANHFYSRAILYDYARAMETLQSLELIVSAPRSFVPPLEHMASLFTKSVRSRIQVIGLEESTGYTWTQDYLKPFAGERAGLIAALAEGHQGYGAITDPAMKEVMATSQSFFGMAYGNVVVGDRHVFVGSDIIEQAVLLFKAPREQIKAALSSEVGKPVLEVGFPSEKLEFLVQPSFHIDLSMAVVVDRRSGQEVVLVNSPREFLKALGFSDILEMTRQQYYQELEDFFQRFAASRKGRPLFPNEKLLVQSLHELDYQDMFEDELKHLVVARSLARHGYQVLRVPGKNHQKNSFHKAGRPAFNYVNVVLSGRHALIPSFGIPELDDKAFKIYERLGLHVITMPSASYSLRLGGGVRCLSTTFRKPLQPK